MYNKKFEIILLAILIAITPVVSTTLFINFNLNASLYNDPEYYILLGSVIFMIINVIAILRLIQILFKQ